MTAIRRTINTPIHQRERARADQVLNNAGGYVYKISPVEHLRRFLILGTEGGTFYQSEKAITREAMQMVETIVANRDISPRELIDLCMWAADNAPKRTYALWVMAQALSTGTIEHKSLVQFFLPGVIRTGTDLFEFVSYVEALRGWGPAARKAVQRILLGTPVEKLGLWTVKYRDRHGWTWKDVLRVAHAKSKSDPDPRRSLLFDFMLDKAKEETGITVVDGYKRVQTLTDSSNVLAIVQGCSLPWEALTDEQRTDDVWKACLPNIGEQAVLRNLASFTRRGLDKDSAFMGAVRGRISDANRLHPLKVLDALKTYSSGGNVGRSQAGTYSPRGPWVDALEMSLERSFTAGVEATGKRIYVGLDVSGSMDHLVSGSAVLSCREAGAAIALAVAKNEPDYQIFGFTAGTRGTGPWGSRGSTKMTELGITARSSFREAVKRAKVAEFGGTDCALPMLHAAEQGYQIDTFVIITDNETWAGSVHPSKALVDYRKRFGINAKLAVIGLTSTGFSIADPRDPGMLDFVGFSQDLPNALASFINL